MLFSIIVPIYQVERYLHQCIESVLQQSFSDFELILVDDGSPDGCPQLCDAYAQADSRIKVIHKENGGLASARNAGIAAAVGRYVVSLDSDDYYADTGFLERLSACLENEPDLVMFQRLRLFESSGEMGEEPTGYSEDELLAADIGALFLLLSRRDRLDASAALKAVKRTVLTENGIVFPVGVLSEDIEWFFRLAAVVRSACVMNGTGYCYRIRSGSISHTRSSKHTRNMVSIVTENAEKLQHTHMEPRMQTALMNYLAYQYYIATGMVRSETTGDERKELYARLQDCRWLVDKSISPKTRAAAAAVKLLGKGARIVLGYYVRAKR